MKSAVMLLVLLFPPIAEATIYRYVGDRNTKEFLSYYDDNDYTHYDLKAGEHGFLDILVDTEGSFTIRLHSILEEALDGPHLDFKAMQADYTVPADVTETSHGFQVLPKANGGQFSLWKDTDTRTDFLGLYLTAFPYFQIYDSVFYGALGNKPSVDEWLELYFEAPVTLQSATPPAHMPDPATWMLLTIGMTVLLMKRRCA